jgi:hypothetical protein
VPDSDPQGIWPKFHKTGLFTCAVLLERSEFVKKLVKSGPNLSYCEILGNQKSELGFGQKFCNLISLFGTVHCEDPFTEKSVTGDSPKTVLNVLSTTTFGSYEVFFRPSFGLNNTYNVLTYTTFMAFKTVLGQSPVVLKNTFLFKNKPII